MSIISHYKISSDRETSDLEATRSKATMESSPGSVLGPLGPLTTSPLPPKGASAYGSCHTVPLLTPADNLPGWHFRGLRALLLLLMPAWLLLLSIPS